MGAGNRVLPSTVWLFWSETRGCTYFCFSLPFISLFLVHSSCMKPSDTVMLMPGITISLLSFSLSPLPLSLSPLLPPSLPLPQTTAPSWWTAEISLSLTTGTPLASQYTVHCTLFYFLWHHWPFLLSHSSRLSEADSEISFSLEVRVVCIASDSGFFLVSSFLIWIMQ